MRDERKKLQEGVIKNWCYKKCIIYFENVSSAHKTCLWACFRGHKRAAFLYKVKQQTLTIPETMLHTRPKTMYKNTNSTAWCHAPKNVTKTFAHFHKITWWSNHWVGFNRTHNDSLCANSVLLLLCANSVCSMIVVLTCTCTFFSKAVRQRLSAETDDIITFY